MSRFRSASAAAHGRIRRSQIVTTFGPGALLDLPNHAVIVGGLDAWTGVTEPVREERLLEWLRHYLDLPRLELKKPPVERDPNSSPPPGIVGYVFPQWFVATYDTARGTTVRSRPLVRANHLRDGRYFGPDKKKHKVVPMRFLQACPLGHIDDIDWQLFVHGKDDQCQRALWLDEYGTGGELANLWVRCECNKARSLATAPLGSGEAPLGFCRGRRPWLGPNNWERCGGEQGQAKPNRLLVRHASNAYFPEKMSVISLPDRDEHVRKAVDAVWDDFLQYVESPDDLRRERKKAKVHAALEGISDDEAWAEIQRRRGPAGPPKKTPKQVEAETLMAQPHELGEDKPEGTFYARRMNLPKKRSGPVSLLERVVLVHRLREVTVQLGFTRFEPSQPTIDGELDLNTKRQDLATDTTWLPAVENLGEGIFLAFDRERLGKWQKQDTVVARERKLRAGFDRWRASHTQQKLEFVGLQYILLHSLSHLLIQAMSLECGYAAASIRERIYVTPAAAGILLFTGSPDAEGTLGGLVQQARRIEEHLANAVELGRLCSNDPVCAQHDPANVLEERYLHGAACHGCLLIAEPSCERRNEQLDRALVVPTVEAEGGELFADQSE